MPEQLECDLKQLKHIGVTIEYIKEDYRTDAHWIYEPSLEIPYHRILLRKNFAAIVLDIGLKQIIRVI